MDWIESVRPATKAGHDVVMSPRIPCYFDYTYGSNSSKRAYGFEPCEAFPVRRQNTSLDCRRISGPYRPQTGIGRPAGLSTLARTRRARLVARGNSRLAELQGASRCTLVAPGRAGRPLLPRADRPLVGEPGPAGIFSASMECNGLCAQGGPLPDNIPIYGRGKSLGDRIGRVAGRRRGGLDGSASWRGGCATRRQCLPPRTEASCREQSTNCASVRGEGGVDSHGDVLLEETVRERSRQQRVAKLKLQIDATDRSHDENADIAVKAFPNH